MIKYDCNTIGQEVTMAIFPNRGGHLSNIFLLKKLSCKTLLLLWSLGKHGSNNIDCFQVATGKNFFKNFFQCPIAQNAYIWISRVSA